MLPTISRPVRPLRGSRDAAFHPCLRLLFALWLAVPITVPATAATSEILVGRTVTGVTATGGGEFDIRLRLSVFNLTDRDLHEVILYDRFAAGVSVRASTPAGMEVGGQWTWALGTAPAHGEGVVHLELTAAGLPAGATLDAGAEASGVYYLTAVSHRGAPATLIEAASPAEALQATIDANAEDYFIRRKAAELNYDPAAITAFIQNEIAFDLYDGSLRGARGTLWSAAGNALDQASLGIALFRACGIPARYVDGVISATDAARLIAGMFPEENGPLGLVPEGLPLADPAGDPALIAEATAHTWLEYGQGGAWEAVDPAFGNAPAIRAAGPVYTEIPDERRHTIRLRTVVESVGMFGLNPLKTPLDVTLRTVEIVGEPITVGHASKRTVTGFFGIFSTVHDYTPYVAIGTLAVPGEPFKEQWSSGIAQVSDEFLVATWLRVEVAAPNGTVENYERPLFDKFGFVRREKGQDPSTAEFTVRPSEPALSEADYFTVFAPVSRTDPALLAHLRARIDAHRRQYERIAPLLPGINGQNPSPQERAILLETSALFSELAVFSSQVIGLDYVLRSQAVDARTAAGFSVRAYADSPQLILVSSRAENNNLTFRLDLRRTHQRVLPNPGQTAFADYFYRSARGRLNAALEDLAAADNAFATGAVTHSLFTVLAAARDQGIDLAWFNASNVDEVDALPVSEEARLRVRRAIEAGWIVEIPAAAPVVDGSPVIAWWEVNGETGEIFAVTEDGGHQAIINIVAIVNGTVLNKIVGAEIGVITGFFSQFYGFMGGFLSGLVETQDLQKAAARGKQVVSVSVAELCAGAFGEAAGGGLTGSLVSGVLAGGSSAVLSGNTSFDLFLRLAIARTLESVILSMTGIGDTLQVGMCLGGLGAIEWLKANFGDDPEAPLYYMDPRAFDPVPEPVVSGGLRVAADARTGAASGVVETELVRITGGLIVEATPSGPWAFPLRELESDAAELRDASGALVASGTLRLTADAPQPAWVDTAGPLILAGTGSVSIRAGVADAAAGSAWTEAELAVASPAVFRLRGTWSVNGAAATWGEYTLDAPAARGRVTGPVAMAGDVAGLTVHATRATLGLGGGEGALMLGGAPLSVGDGVGLSEFAGQLTLAPGALLSAAIDGEAGGCLQLLADPSVLAASGAGAFRTVLMAQGGPAHTDLRAHAPRGWGGVLDGTGAMRLVPPPTQGTGDDVARVFVSDPANPDLAAQARIAVSVDAVGAGARLEAVHRPELYVTDHGAAIRGVVEVSVHGQSPEMLTVALAVSGAPEGQAFFGSDALTLSGVETKRTSLYLIPSQPLPPAGASWTMELRAVDAAGGSLLDTVSLLYTLPPIPAALVSVDRPTWHTTRPDQRTITVTVANTGNIAGTFAWMAEAPEGFEIDMPALGVLLPGDSVTRTLTLRAPEAPAGTDAAIRLTLLLDGEPIRLLGLRVRVLDSAAAAAAYNAAEAARNRVLFDLYEALDILAEAAALLETDLGSTAARDAAVDALSALADTLPDEFAIFAPAFDGLAATLRLLIGPALAPGLSSLAVALDELADALAGTAVVVGDLNGDGVIDWRDLFLFQKAWHQSPPDPPGADLLQDGEVNALDLLQLHELRKSGR